MKKEILLGQFMGEIEEDCRKKRAKESNRKANRKYYRRLNDEIKR
jgi:hypothetical protein